MRQIAETADLEAISKGGKQFFHYSDVKEAHLPNGELVLMGLIANAKQFPVANRIAEDPVALSVMAGYLGYTPTRWEINLFWSFASDAALEARKVATQTTEFHFDVHSYNFAYAAYYVLDTDRNNGAHVMITGSHKDKPTAWLFGSANQKDDVVYAHYPKDKVLIIEGKGGYRLLAGQQLLPQGAAAGEVGEAAVPGALLLGFPRMWVVRRWGGKFGAR